MYEQIMKSIHEQLEERFGLFLNEEELAQVLRFRSVQALAAAVRRKSLGELVLFRLPGRPGRWVTSSDLAQWIQKSYYETADQKPRVVFSEPELAGVTTPPELHK